MIKGLTMVVNRKAFLVLLLLCSATSLVSYWSVSSSRILHIMGWTQSTWNSSVEEKTNATYQPLSDQPVMLATASRSFSNQPVIVWTASYSPKLTSSSQPRVLPLTVPTPVSLKSGLSSSVEWTHIAPTTTLPGTTTSKKPDKLLVCHRLSGRLGNQLFQVASVLGLSYATNRTAVIFSSSLTTALRQPLLSAQEEKVYDKWCAAARGVGERTCCRFDDHIVSELQKQGDVRLGGYLQSWKYFDEFRDRIKTSLAFSEEVVREAAEIVRKIRENHNLTLIGVHVRRGDFLLQSSQNSGYVTATAEYFQKSMRYFLNRFPDATFVAACETPEWCKANFLQNISTVYLEKRSGPVDLSILAQLDHVIISTGTYSWWAGYLNPGITVFFKDFIVPNTFIGRQYSADGKDYVLPEWIPL